MRQLFVFFILYLSIAGVGAQTVTTLKTAGSKARKSYDEGKIYASQGSAAVALGYFEKALKEEPGFIDAMLALGDTWAEIGDQFKAERYFEEAIALDSAYAPLAYYRVGKVEWANEKYAESAAHLEQFVRTGSGSGKTRGDAQRLLASAQFAAEAVKNPVPFKLVSLGSGVNTATDEYLPTITADAQTLIFTRREKSGDENFYKSIWKDSVWQKAEPLEGINTSDNEGAQAISPDGFWIIFTACDREGDGSQGRCDLYWSLDKNGVWTKPVPFSKAINSPAWESQPTISANGRSIMFSSNRGGGQGNNDLWVTHRQDDGKWAKPENLGPGINTGGQELTPYLHPDGQTLYFASDSLPGMGGLDLYCVRRNPDGSWGKPQNLGYPINTRSDEAALNVSLDGRTAYYATNRNGQKNGVDIYAFELPEAVRPRAVTYAKAVVRDARTGEPLVAKVDFTDLKTGKLYISANTRTDGTFLVCLPAGADYALNVNKEQYLFYSENFNLVETATFKEPFLLDIALQSLTATAEGAPGTYKPVVLRNVFFETGSAALRPESASELDRLAALMLGMPALRIRINGHTDNVGDDASNQRLSEARAKAVYDYLVQKNIEAARLEYRGFGESKPLGPNDTPENRSRNRRTEFEVVGN